MTRLYFLSFRDPSALVEDFDVRETLHVAWRSARWLGDGWHCIETWGGCDDTTMAVLYYFAISLHNRRWSRWAEYIAAILHECDYKLATHAHNLVIPHSPSSLIHPMANRMVFIRAAIVILLAVCALAAPAPYEVKEKKWCFVDCLDAELGSESG
ncbi:hypothetical protein H4582DRAFT_2020730 [Lactarius indigo]|nr:hypothetical protein H4582DRAFT_2020730 [Lactarius indigo]